jgi:hypothetical protein
MARGSTATRQSKSGSRQSRSGSNQNDSKQGEADRYRQAADDALQQLDWAIGYLHGIRKVEISKALSKNRSFIRRRLLGESEESLPGEQTDET